LISSLALNIARRSVGSMEGAAGAFLLVLEGLAPVFRRGVGRAPSGADESTLDCTGAAAGDEDEVPAGLEIR
jgi:hypothetical protein